MASILSRGINVVTAICAAAIVLMMLQVTLDVAGKNLFNMPVPATLAFVSNYYMVLVSFLPLAVSEVRRSHISVEVVTDRMPIRARHHVIGWTYLFSAATFALLAYVTFGEAVTKQQVAAFMIERDTRVPIWLGYYALPLGFGLMSLTVLYRFFTYITGQPDTLTSDAVGDIIEDNLSR
jgi:TRAP-type C4-dicarboxylate transport system permease small subunit